METVLDDLYLLLVGNRISNPDDLLSILDKVMGVGGSLVIVADDVEGPALAADAWPARAAKDPEIG